MSHDQISLRLPASTEFGRIARAAAANLATRLGWQAVDIDSLRLAIDEALAVLVGPKNAVADSTVLDIEFEILDDGIDLQIQASGGSLAAIPADRIDRFERLAAPGFATATVEPAAHRVHIIKNV